MKISCLPSWRPWKIQECHFHIFLWWCRMPAVTTSSPQPLSPWRPAGEEVLKKYARTVPGTCSWSRRHKKMSNRGWLWLFISLITSLFSLIYDKLSARMFWPVNAANLGPDISSSSIDWLIHHITQHTHTQWTLAYLVVKFRKLNFYFLPLEEMILCLLTHWRDEIKLSCHWIRLLEIKNKGRQRKKGEN